MEHHCLKAHDDITSDSTLSSVQSRGVRKVPPGPGQRDDTESRPQWWQRTGQGSLVGFFSLKTKAVVPEFQESPSLGF